MKPIPVNNQKVSEGQIAFVPLKYAMVLFALFFLGLTAGMAAGGALGILVGILPAFLIYPYALTARGKAPGYTTNKILSWFLPKTINRSKQAPPWK
jgi:hypothetical protein